MGDSSEYGVALGSMLVEQGLLSQAELKQALKDQKQTGGKLGEILLAQGKVSRPLLDRFLANQGGVVLEEELGFGSGLRAMIEQRHLERSGIPVRLIPSNEAPETSVPLRDRRLADRRAQSDRRQAAPNVGLRKRSSVA